MAVSFGTFWDVDSEKTSANKWMQTAFDNKIPDLQSFKVREGRIVEVVVR